MIRKIKFAGKDYKTRLDVADDIKTILFDSNKNLWYEIKDIEFICTLFVRLFLREVKPFYNFLEESNKILEV